MSSQQGTILDDWKHLRDSGQGEYDLLVFCNHGTVIWKRVWLSSLRPACEVFHLAKQKVFANLTLHLFYHICFFSPCIISKPIIQF